MYKNLNPKAQKTLKDFSDKKKVEILLGALDYMQQYNGRSKQECIKLSIENI